MVTKLIENMYGRLNGTIVERRRDFYFVLEVERSETERQRSVSQIKFPEIRDIDFSEPEWSESGMKVRIGLD